jgi:tetratricopeptide (TPR) repeat protein
LKARAGEALVRAAERASSLGAATEAQRYFEEAAELKDGELAHAELQGRAGEMAHRANKPLEARALLEPARAMFAERGETRAAARLAAVLAEIDFEGGDPQRGVARLRPAVEALEAAAPDADLAEAAAQLGRFLALSGEYEQADPYLERALALAEKLELTETLAQALNTKAVTLLRRHRPYEAPLLLRGALELALAHDLHAAALRAYNNCLVELWVSGRVSKSHGLVQDALDLARRAGLRASEAQFLGASVVTLRELGRWDEALACAIEAERLAATEFAQSWLLSVVPIHCERGAPEEARRLVERLGLVAGSKNPDHVAAREVAQASLLRAEGRPKDALAAAGRALAVHDETGAGARDEALVEALEASATIGEPELSEQLSRVDALPPGELNPFLKAQQARFRARLDRIGADVLYATAEHLLRELELPFRLAVVQLEHAEFLAAEGRPEDAKPLLAEARETFERLNARPWLESLAAAAGAPVSVA